MKKPQDLIKRPLVTEKSTLVREKGYYVFIVDRKANKREVRQAIEYLFNVKVDKVRTLISPGKIVKKVGRVVGKESALKKAYVKLKEGSIEFYEGV